MNRNFFKAHPWHGVQIGDQMPELVTAFIEIVPTDTVKYEIDKQTGYLKIDRPQKFSNIVPALYGFLPQTYCSDGIAELARKYSGKDIERGDGDPLDILVLSERAITHGDILCQAIPIGGIRMIDKGEGLGQSIQKLGYLWGAHTDFIMSIIVEELGVFGIIITIGLLLLITLRGLYFAKKCQDSFGTLLAVGISSMVGCALSRRISSAETAPSDS